MIPDFKLIADNQDITNLIFQRLLSLNFNDETGFVSDSLSIKLDNRDNVLEVPPAGAKLSLYLGYMDDIYLMGSFVVDEIEISSPPKVINIVARASDSFNEGCISDIKVLRNKSWHETTYAEIMNSIAGSYGLKPQIDNKFSELVVDHLDQTDESDIAFLNRIVEEIDGYVKVANGYLLAGVKGNLNSPSGKELPITSFRETDLLNWRVKLTSRDKYKSVKARCYDKSQAKENFITVGEGEPTYNLPGLYANSDKARKCAESKLNSIKRGTYTLEATILGNPLVVAESLISFENQGSVLDGLWLIESASHDLSSSGYMTTINATKREG